MVGNLTGDSKLKSEGQADQLKRKVKNAIGSVKDASRAFCSSLTVLTGRNRLRH